MCAHEISEKILKVEIMLNLAFFIRLTYDRLTIDNYSKRVSVNILSLTSVGIGG